MVCAWESFLSLLPLWMRADVDHLGKASLQELRLRIGFPPELNTADRTLYLSRMVLEDDVLFCINAASRYSPWTAATAAYGYITATGGHRIGICGDAVTSNGVMTGIRTPTMLCIRVARDIPGIAEAIPRVDQSILLIGPPGSGKTTLLRDLIRRYSNADLGSISVVDERGEIFPYAKGNNTFLPGKHTDILTGCKKAHGIDSVLRCMGPTAIAIDEITAQEDCVALTQAAWCGVRLFATAHAGSRNDLFNRTIYRTIIESRIFDSIIILKPDKSWTYERMRL